MSSSLTLYDSSAPLLSKRFNPPSSFPQSGSWSWVALIDVGVRGAIQVLSRYSAAGVDPYTVIVGQLVCGNFKLSLRGSERLKCAIMELKSMSVIGSMLHFGFGVDSLVRNLAATEEGGILVALCAAAVEAFLPDVAANILWELVRIFKVPEKQTPSSLQWKALVQACAGTLSETTFPRLAEYFMQLHSDNNRLSIGQLQWEPHPTVRGVSSPDSLAEALLAIGKVSTGELLSISIVGGADAGWLAAIAQWIFDLRVTLCNSDGEILYGTSLPSQPQVQIVFIKPVQETSDLQGLLQGKVFPLRDITDLFSLRQNELGSALVCSRVPWDNALRSTFGSDFKRLMEMRRSFGRAMASAGYVFDRIAKADPATSPDQQRSCQTYYDQGRSRGFVAWAVALFPELETLRNFMETTVTPSFDSACEIYDESRAHIKSGCDCDICRDNYLYEERFCLVILVETIIVIVRFMSGVSAPSTLLPMRSGLEAFYGRQLKLHESERFKNGIEKYGPIGAVLDYYHSVFGTELNAEENTDVPRLVHAARLFSGRDIERTVGNQAAINVSGIVVFLSSLLLGDDVLSSDPKLMGKCTVTPGHIEMHGRSHAYLEDFSDFDIVGRDYRSRPGGGIGAQLLIDPSPLTDNYTNVALVAREASGHVNVGLSFHRSGEDRLADPSVLVGPAALNRSVLSSAGSVYCDGRNCKSAIPPRQREISKCVKVLENPGRCEIWLFEGDHYGRLVARALVSNFSLNYCVILQEHECLSCCVRAAELSQIDRAIIIARRPHSNA